MKSEAKIVGITLLLLFFSLLSVFAQVRLPRLIGDGMVLQRDAQVKIWGWAAANEKVSISFHDSVYRAPANEKGEWSIVLSGLKAGGPFTMSVSASNTITVNDILIGDVWVCSGQSNMELPMKRVSPLYETKIAKSENPYIRHFAVPQKYNFNTPENDLSSGKWESTTPANVLNFSAVAFFFGTELYEKFHIPIGLINASLGGSPAESWLSEEALKQFPDHYKEAQRFKDANLIRQIENQDKIRMDAWYGQLRQKDEGYRDPLRLWSDPLVNTADWGSMNVPGYWASTELGPVNGVFVGATGYQYPPRRYDVPLTVLREGRNTIVVRVISNTGKGGFVLDKPYELVCAGQKIDL